MTKLEMAEIIVDSNLWDGEKNPRELAKNYTKEEIQDMYDMLKEAEWEMFD